MSPIVSRAVAFRRSMNAYFCGLGFLKRILFKAFSEHQDFIKNDSLINDCSVLLGNKTVRFKDHWNHGI